MTQIQEQKFNKFIAFREYISKNPLSLESYLHLKPHYKNFVKLLNLILKTLEMMEENNETNSMYEVLKDELIKTALSISRKVTAYSLLEELTDVQGLFCYSSEELMQETDDKLLKKCKNLLVFISNYKNELTEYGIDSLLEDKLHDLTDQFFLTIENKILNLEINKQSEEHLAHLLNEAEEIYDKKLVLLTESILTRPS